MNYPLPYEQWKALVDEELFKLIGLDSEGIPDYDYRTSYAVGDPPRQTALEALEASELY